MVMGYKLWLLKCYPATIFPCRSWGCLSHFASLHFAVCFAKDRFVVTCHSFEILRTGLSRKPVLKDRVVSHPPPPWLGLTAKSHQVSHPIVERASSISHCSLGQCRGLFTWQVGMHHTGFSETASLFGTQVLMML